jgi:chloramphenicol-sensitive protein RarD
MKDTDKGILFTIIPFFFWGLFPIYWKLLSHVDVYQILAHRVVWSFISVAGFISIQRRWEEVKNALQFRSNRQMLSTTALLIGGNWLIYIYAVNSNHIIEASLGYFMNPLVAVLLGVIFLRERLSRTQIFSVMLAGTGLIFLAIKLGRFPWIAILLSLTLGGYGLLRKIASPDSMIGLLIETAFLTPFSLFFLIVFHIKGYGSFRLDDWGTGGLLIGAGIITAITLVLFIYGARLIQYSTVGILQYIIPTIQLLVGIIIYKEPFNQMQMISFSFVWFGIILFSCSSLANFKKDLVI